jgi:hypothetical protein
MIVITVDGDVVGNIKEVLGTRILVDRDMARDLYVPIDAIAKVEVNRVALNVRRGEMDEVNRGNPPLAGQAAA